MTDRMSDGDFEARAEYHEGDPVYEEAKLARDSEKCMKAAGLRIVEEITKDLEEMVGLQRENADLKAEKDRAREAEEKWEDKFNQAKNYTSFQAEPCPLCKYENGVFIMRCNYHEVIMVLEQNYEKLEAENVELKAKYKNLEDEHELCNYQGHDL